MTDRELLELALEALLDLTAPSKRARAAITSIKQALAAPVKDNSNYRLDPPGLDPAGGTQVSKVWWDGDKLMAKPIPLVEFYKPVQKPVAWKWHQAPVKTAWGHEMVVADLAIDKDHTVSIYCERDQTTKVEAMFNPPAAPVQEPVAWIEHHKGGDNLEWDNPGGKCTPLYTTPPAQPAPVQEPVAILPDGSAFGVMSFPLPSDHWLYAPNEYRDGEYEPIDLPKPILTHALRESVVAAVRYAVRGATMRGQETDFDPDAIVQNAVYALCGPYTTPPAAQRQWVGLTDKEMYLNCPNWLSHEQCKTWVQQIEAKLKEKNNG